MLKRALPLFALAVILMAPSCQNKDKMKTDSVAEVETPAEPTTPDQPDVAEIDAADMTSMGDSLFMSYERTACFGRCPIFIIRLYKSGYVTYEGINFVDNMGYYESRVDKTELELLKEKTEEVGFADWDASYDDKMISDLPAQKFSALVNGKQKKVVARYNVPDEVRQFGVFIESRFADTEWIPVTRDH